MDLKGRITVYSIVGCPSCMRAKSSLQEENLPYADISLDAYPQLRQYVKERTGKTTVPQIFFNHIHVGGNDELQKLLSNKAEFEKLVNEVKHNIAPPDAPELPDPSTAVSEAGQFEFICEPDEYAKFIADFKESGIIKNNRDGILTVHKNSFTGKDFVEWAMKTKAIEYDDAVEMGQQLIDLHFGQKVKASSAEFMADDTYYRLLEDDESSALNAGEMSQCQPRKATEVAEDMRRLILALYSAFLSADGKKVDYNGLGRSSEFERYTGLTKELLRVQVEGITREAKLAFFINIYNALVIHAIVERGPPSNLWQRYKFFNTVKYIIGGQPYSLQDIENGVLRGNRKGVGMLFKPFGNNDPRIKVALEKVEPMIHFALVCGAKSCPPIKTYSPVGIDDQLQAAEAFLEGEDAISVDLAKGKIMISQIFKWYRVDFGHNNHEVLEYIHKHMADCDKRRMLGELLACRHYSLHYNPYDWTINSK